MTVKRPLALVVDDEPGILRLLEFELKSQDFNVITAKRGEDALRLADEHAPDVVLLDVIMPGMSGTETMRRLRDRSRVPVILVTGKSSDQEKIQGLGLGADDYIVKPFNPGEVSARVQAVLRRTRGLPPTDPVIKTPDLEIDVRRRLVMRNGEVVHLTRTEWQLLRHLCSHTGKVILNADLLSGVWGPEYRNDLQYLRVWVSRLRRKLETDPAHPQLIKTKQGIGYMFDIPAAGNPLSRAPLAS